MIRVAIVDDHPLILKILRYELAEERDISVIWALSAVDKFYTQLRSAVPDVLILDLSFSGQGFEPSATVRDLRTRFPEMNVLILTSYDDPVWIEEMVNAGARGYVVKSDDFSLRLADGIRSLAQGKSFLSASAVEGLTNSRQKYTLTPRERAILRLATEGKSNPEIASILDIANGTVRNHISNIYAKLGVDSREGAIHAAQSLRELPKANTNARHEIRTPLHTLMGLARLLQTRLERDGSLQVEKSSEFLQQIILEAERLDNLIDEIFV